MKPNIQVKNEPVDNQHYSNRRMNDYFRFYRYPISVNSSYKATSQHEQEASTCVWCKKLGFRSFTLRSENGESKNLCSEVCFNQYRRASFKKNRLYSSDSVNSPSTHTTEVNKFNVKRNSVHSSLPEKRLKLTNNIHLQTIDRRIIPTTLTAQTTMVTRKHIRKNHSIFSASTSTEASSALSSKEPWATINDANLYQSSSNVTCLLPTFIPLPIPIPIPLCLPAEQGCRKCSTEFCDQKSQNHEIKRLSRRISI